MARAVHRQGAEINMDYINVPEASTRNGSDKQEVHPVAGEKLIRGVAVGFGLLCVLQVLVNVSLRLVLYTQTSCIQTVCKNVTIDPYLQQGWMYLHPSLYYISSTKEPYNKSREDCKQKDADLLIINTKEEQNFMRKFNRPTWIGLRYTARTDNWTWEDGTPLTESYWSPGEPNGFEGKEEKCVEIRFHGTENNWNDIPCMDENFWICEKNISRFVK